MLWAFPRREMWTHSPDGVHLTVSPIYMPLMNENSGFKNTNVNRPFSKYRKPLFSGWVGSGRKSALKDDGNKWPLLGAQISIFCLWKNEGNKWPLEAQIEESFQFFFSKKCDFSLKNMKKTERPKWPQKCSTSS